MPEPKYNIEIADALRYNANATEEDLTENLKASLPSECA